jgi:micrococcal nuclease
VVSPPTETTTSPATTSTSSPKPPDLIPGAVLATVVGVTDGDTINVRFEDRSVEPVRLIGINSPESGECMASEATSYLRDLIDGLHVGLVSDVSNRDQYNRLLRYIYLGDLFVNEELVRNGYALAHRYEPDTAWANVLDAAQTEAQESQVGMWSPTACGPAPTASIQILEVVYDAPGDDNQNLNGEWVVIANSGTTPVELSGWSLKDESASHRYYFPSSFVLSPGSEVVIYTGCGGDSEASLYWCNTGSAVWNNSGDSAFLLDPNGNIADQWEYN